MPLVRISLLKGKPKEYLRALSDGVHQALVEAYNVPPDDRFQLIHQHKVLSSNERDEWSFGNGLASYVKDADPG
jgi:Tautomerase enzyme